MTACKETFSEIIIKKHVFRLQFEKGGARTGKRLKAREMCKDHSVHVSGKLPTYPSPKPTVTLTPHIKQNVSLGEG